MGFVTEKFGERLKLLRELAEMSQSELAEELGVSRGAISYYENGDRTPDIEFLDKVRDYFDLPYDYILGNTDNAVESHAFMEEGFGLSDVSLNIMDMNNTIGHIISSILEHDSFNSLTVLIHQILNETSYHDPTSFLYDKDRERLSASQLKYLSYLVSNVLNTILSDVLAKEYRAKAYANLSLEEMQLKINSSKDEITRLLGQFEKEDNEIKQRFETERQAYQADPKIQKSIDRRKKVHYALGDKAYLKTLKKNSNIDELS